MTVPCREFQSFGPTMENTQSLASDVYSVLLARLRVSMPYFQIIWRMGCLSSAYKKKLSIYAPSLNRFDEVFLIHDCSRITRAQLKKALQAHTKGQVPLLCFFVHKPNSASASGITTMMMILQRWAGAGLREVDLRLSMEQSRRILGLEGVETSSLTQDGCDRGQDHLRIWYWLSDMDQGRKLLNCLEPLKYENPLSSPHD
ncbi:uncharacterized protein LOC115089422 [Rhinatrema bivittatum]|uniref:uncharacterized protein LOC115089422 n=1 Tax=Rhinatrema bivittatum TaxID=194408 RepID=UPI0011264DB7|nr:uncharacterized protein LOC115089422 [Rhinatrema bivittatum]